MGRTVTGVEVGAISALKTFRPAPSDLAGGRVVSADRHGKWLDLGGAPPAAATNALEAEAAGTTA